MRKILLVGTLLLLAACGSSNSGVSVSTSGDKTQSTAAGNSTEATSGGADTIPVNDLGDIPQECIQVFSDYLKAIEPVVSKVDWSKATMSDFETLGTQMDAATTQLDTQSAAKGCDKYRPDTTDEKVKKQLEALAADVAPGTVSFIHFLESLESTQTTVAGASGDCDSIIAQIEPYLKSGKTIKDLTIGEISKVSNLFTQIGTACPADKAAAFYQRADVQAFAGG